MYPLSFAKQDEKLRIVRVSGKEDAIRHAEELGFVPDAEVMVVSQHGGNLIVKVKNSRVAIGRDLAAKISVEDW